MYEVLLDSEMPNPSGIICCQFGTENTSLRTQTILMLKNGRTSISMQQMKDMSLINLRILETEET